MRIDLCLLKCVISSTVAENIGENTLLNYFFMATKLDLMQGSGMSKHSNLILAS